MLCCKSIIALATVALLGACSPVPAPSTSGSPPVAGAPAPSQSAPAAGVALVSQACSAIQPTVGAVADAMKSASLSDQAKATNILSYEQAACNSVDAINKVVAADPSGGMQSAAWIAALGAGLTQALPVILAATGAVKS